MSNLISFNEYQDRALGTARYPKVAIVDADNRPVSAPLGWVYPAGKLGGETGELQEKVFKLLRDANGVVTPEVRAAVVRELGDILWYVSAVAHEFKATLLEVAETNLAKLASRAERNVLHGSGDDR